MPELSVPLAAPEDWVLIERVTGLRVTVRAKTWFDARARAGIAYVERYGGEAPDPERFDLIVNPTMPKPFERKDEYVADNAKLPALVDIKTMKRWLEDFSALNENLTATQTRCTELLEENRRLRRELSEAKRA